MFTGEIMKTGKELKEEATALGIQFHPNIGADKLAERITAHRRTYKVEDDVGAVNSSTRSEPIEEPVKQVVPAKPETLIQKHARLRKEQKALIRVIIRCNDENKKEWVGETFKVSNTLHTMTRYVPFDNENGWHIEQAILDTIKESVCVRFKESTLPNGTKVRTPYSIKKYNIELLPPLTREQLKELATEQAARGSID